MRSLVLALLVVGCATARPVTSAAPAPVIYPDPPWVHLEGRSFVRQQHIAARHGEQAGAFDAVLQKKGADLLLVGLTPFGTRAFTLELVGGELHATTSVPLPLPFPPRYVLDDVERTYFAGLEGAPLADGTHVVERGGERVTELWAAGRLQRRTFVRVSGDLPGEVRIDFVGGMSEDRSPARIEFDNGWFGYHLTITTTGEQDL